MNSFLLIGYGMIGKERLRALMKINVQNNFICDIFDPHVDSNTEVVNENLHINFLKDKKQLLFKKYDLVIICTPHNMFKEYASMFLDKNIDILIEKPFGRNSNEMKAILNHQNKSKIHIGFNYPYFKAIESLKSDLKSNKFGELISIDMCIGHGNSPNMGKSWKLNPEMCGGGVLLDPGIHMIDLLYFLFNKDIDVLSASTWDGFWNTGIEEEAKVLMKMDKTLIFLDISSVKWRSKFEISINGKNAYARISGRGKSYGEQLYYYGERWSWLNGKPQDQNELLISKSTCENSFEDELRDIILGREANTKRAISGMNLYEKIKHKTIRT